MQKRLTDLYKKTGRRTYWSGTSEENGLATTVTFDQPIIYLDDKTVVFDTHAPHNHIPDTLRYFSTNGKTLKFTSLYDNFTVETDTLSYDYKSGDIHYIRWPFDGGAHHLDVHSR